MDYHWEVSSVSKTRTFVSAGTSIPAIFSETKRSLTYSRSLNAVSLRVEEYFSNLISLILGEK